MKKSLLKWGLLGMIILIHHHIQAQQDWPKEVVAGDGTIIKVYQPQPDSFARNVLTFRSAVSVVEKDASDPVFGTMWSTATVSIDRDDREMTVNTITISALKIPADSSSERMAYLRSSLEAQLPGIIGSIPLDEILTSLQQALDERNLSKDINTQAPKIIYMTTPSILVTIDGAPRLQRNKKWDVDAVVNSPFTIVQDRDHTFYLYGGGRWYSATSATGPYTYNGQEVSSRLRKIEKTYNDAHPDRDEDNDEHILTDTVIPGIAISTTPAELLQTNGKPEFIPIDGTALLYVGNSPNDLFMDTNSQRYYLLLSGRWYYNSEISEEGWTYTAADRLPPDFARIPEGSAKDNVLASVAGTQAAREATMDAQIPQTAKVDRKKATTHVTYDGAPKFEPIDGTGLQYAVNTASTVLQYENRFYAVDDGIWFVSSDANGPWIASDTRPGGLDQIPPSSPVYNAKFVDIYDVTPDYIYAGYSAGYLNNFIYGPTVVYGTGFYYTPWIGDVYYPRPWSWGFSVVYNPWYGWGFGAGFGFDWFNIGFGAGWGGWSGGWWGPGFYHPACWGYGRGFRPQPFYGHNQPMAGHTGIHTRNNIFSDHSGNVYQRAENGVWQPRSTHDPGEGRPPGATSNLNLQQEMRDRGMLRTQNFRNARTLSARPFGGFSPGGGFRGGMPGGRRR